MISYYPTVPISSNKIQIRYAKEFGISIKILRESDNLSGIFQHIAQKPRKMRKDTD